MPLLEELQRASQPSHGGVEHRIAGERQLSEQLQGVPQVLAGPLEGGITLGAAGKQGGRQDAGKIAPPGSASQQRRSRPEPPVVSK